jgi:hypothetical protein
MVTRRQMLARTGAALVAAGGALREARAQVVTAGGSVVEAAGAVLKAGILQLPAGMNISAGGSGSTYYEGLAIYRNRIREAKGWFNSAGSALTTVDSAGWPTTDFSIFMNAGNFVSTRAQWMQGTWKCGFIGTGAETVTGVNGASVSNVVPGTGGAYTTFDMNSVGTNAGFKVTGTTGGATNVWAYPPSYYASPVIDDKLSPSAFTPEALATYRNAGYIRGMDWTGCVFISTVMTSANRATPANTQCFYYNKGNGLEGIPLECLAAFCMAVGRPMWLNLPNLFDASFTYITDLANALFALVPPGLPIYIEQSDELWNNEGAGIAAWASAATTYGGTNAPVPFYCYQNHNFASIFQGVFGARYGTDVRLVSAWQSGGNGVAFRSHVRSEYATNGWNVANDFYSTALAPYLNTGYTSGQYSNTIAQIQATLLSVAQAVPLANTPSTSVYDIEAVLCVGLKDGLSMLCYEGGWQTNNENAGLVNAGAAILDPGMTAVMEAYYQGVLNSGSRGVPQWTGVDVNTNTSLTPVNESAEDWTTFVTSGSPRQAAIIAANAGSYVLTRNVVSGTGSIIQGNCYIDNATGAVATLGGSGFATPSWAPNYSTSYQATFLINCSKAGTYSLVANLTNSGGSAGSTGLEWAGEKTPFSTSGSVSIPTGTGNVTLGTVALVLGANYVCLTGNGANQSTVAINTLTFN